MDKVTRRSFVAALGATTLAPVGGLLATRAAARTRTPATGAANAPAAYDFFDVAEAQFVEAACERLIPADESAPGALDAGVPRYLDGQLGGAWGAAEHLYRAGPWQPGTYAGGIPSSLSPAQFFRAALRAIDTELALHGAPFAALPRAAQDAYLATLESGEARLQRVPPAAFFDLLLKMTVEGFFAHPVYGPTRDRVAWRVRGFPGAHAAAS
jgi:gluconate 2-dehydrogenase gamma chain